MTTKSKTIDEITSVKKFFVSCLTRTKSIDLKIDSLMTFLRWLAAYLLYLVTVLQLYKLLACSLYSSYKNILYTIDFFCKKYYIDRYRINVNNIKFLLASQDFLNNILLLYNKKSEKNKTNIGKFKFHNAWRLNTFTNFVLKKFLNHSSTFIITEFEGFHFEILTKLEKGCRNIFSSGASVGSGIIKDKGGKVLFLLNEVRDAVSRRVLICSI